MIYAAAWWLPRYIPLQRKFDTMLSSTASSPDSLAHRLPLKHDRCDEDCGPPATLGSLLPFVRTSRGLPIRALGLDQGIPAWQRGIDDLSVIVTYLGRGADL